MPPASRSRRRTLSGVSCVSLRTRIIEFRGSWCPVAGACSGLTPRRVHRERVPHPPPTPSAYPDGVDLVFVGHTAIRLGRITRLIVDSFRTEMTRPITAADRKMVIKSVRVGTTLALRNKHTDSRFPTIVKHRYATEDYVPSYLIWRKSKRHDWALGLRFRGVSKTPPRGRLQIAHSVQVN